MAISIQKLDLGNWTMTAVNGPLVMEISSGSTTMLIDFVTDFNQALVMLHID